jgi:hypothetical protein
VYCLSGRVVVAGEPVQPDQQSLMVLVERAHRHGANGVGACRVEGSM